MEALIPKLFLITAEASIVLFLILVVMIVFNSKAKRKDLKAANELINQFLNNKEERIRALKSHLTAIAYSGNHDEQAENLYSLEKSLLKEFVTLYLRRDTYRLLDYPEVITDADDKFLKTSGSGNASSLAVNVELSKTEENANATIMAREQAESNEAYLKELSELRLKNTELNEHLFEALETITALMSEHGKKTGQEVETNAQKILEAIIYLRDNRLGSDSDPSKLAPSPDDDHDKVDDPWSVDLAEGDATLDDSTAVNLGISDELDTDLDTLEEDISDDDAQVKSEKTESSIDAITATSAEEDPWADALEEQAASEAGTTDTDSAAGEDPWADALAEQASSEAVTTEADVVEEDPWADALAEQAASEADASPEEKDEDPWAAALAEQEKAEKK